MSVFNELFAANKIAKNKEQLLFLGVLTQVASDQVGKSQATMAATALKDDIHVIQPWKADFQKQTGIFCPYRRVKEEKDGCLEHKYEDGRPAVTKLHQQEGEEIGTPLCAEAEDVGESKATKKRTHQQRVCTCIGLALVEPACKLLASNRRH